MQNLVQILVQTINAALQRERIALGILTKQIKLTGLELDIDI